MEANICQCGAVTVSEGNTQWSMPGGEFRGQYPDLKIDNKKAPYGCCDHCVNKWGVDLCECGSGKKFKKCCGHPMQEHGKKQEIRVRF